MENSITFNCHYPEGTTGNTTLSMDFFVKSSFSAISAFYSKIGRYADDHSAFSAVYDYVMQPENKAYIQYQNNKGILTMVSKWIGSSTEKVPAADKKVISAMKKLSKQVRNKDLREAYKPVYDDGKTWFTNSYMLLVLDREVKFSAGEMLDETEHKRIDLKHIVDARENEPFQEVTLPSIDEIQTAELQQSIEDNNFRKDGIYTIEIEGRFYQCEMLLNCLECLGKGEKHFYINPEREYDLGKIVSDDGCCYILPVRKY